MFTLRCLIGSLPSPFTLTNSTYILVIVLFLIIFQLFLRNNYLDNLIRELELLFNFINRTLCEL